MTHPPPPAPECDMPPRLPPPHPLLAHPCPPPPAANWLRTCNPWTWIVRSPRTHLGPATTVTSWGTLPRTVQNPMCIECAMHNGILQTQPSGTGSLEQYKTH